MGALDHAAAHIQRRTGPALYLQGMCAGRRSDNINNGVNGPYLVEMDGVNGDIVDFGLGVAKRLKSPDCGRLDGWPQVCVLDHVPNHR